MIRKEMAEILLNEIDSILYVADMETYELKYINSYTKKLLHLEKSDKSYLGKKCYELLRKLDKPCENCKNSILCKQGYCDWEHFNERVQEYFSVKDKIINIEGKDYHFSLSVKNSDEVYRRNELEYQLCCEQTLLNCVRTLESDLDVQSAINRLLETVTTFYKGDRGYVFEIDYEKRETNNTYEWVEKGKTAEIDNLQNIPLYVIGSWINIFREKGRFYISDIDEDMDTSSETHRILKEQNIKSLIAAPLIKDGLIVGFFGIDNPRENYKDFMVLNSVAYFMQNDIEKRKAYETMEKLSFEDALTGLYNRTKYNIVIEDLQKNTPQKLAVIYMDINGLKLVNDTYGHKNGDLLIKNTAKNITKVFNKNGYRIGGDEFVIIETNISKEILTERIETLKKLMKDNNIKISIGASYRNERVNINEQMSQADIEMYNDKQLYYKQLGR